MQYKGPNWLLEYFDQFSETFPLSSFVDVTKIIFLIFFMKKQV